MIPQRPINGREAGIAMKKYTVISSIIILMFAFNRLTSAQPTQPKDSIGYHQWWFDRWPGRPLNSPTGKLLQQISVKGNRFVNSNGDTILFHGLSISDPDKIEHQGAWNKELFVKLKNLGVMLVRIPVHPIAWRERTPQNYLKLLDQAVEWCTEESLYVNIDWHSIGNLEEGLFQDPMYYTTMQETFNFWRTIASHFAGNNTVACLELFNEPTDFYGRLGNVSWEKWKEINEDLINLIRSYKNQSVPLVAGFDWAYDLTPLHFAPIAASGIAYVTHPYPNKRTLPYVPKWDEDFGFVAERYPVIATEIGFTYGSLEHNLDYGRTIIKYFEQKHISWLCWVFDPEWGPPMITSWKSFDLTAEGKFFEDAVHSKVMTQDSTVAH